jgi:hypothetical protein
MRKPLILGLSIIFLVTASPSYASKTIKFNNQKIGQHCKTLEVNLSVNLPTGPVLTCLQANSKATPKWVQTKPRMFMPTAAPTLPIATPSESPTPTPVNNAPVFSNIRFQSSTIKAGESAQIFFTVTSSIGFSNQTGIVTLMNSSGANFSKILGVFGGGCVATSQTTLTCEGDVQISKTAPAGQYALNIIGFADNNNVSTTINQPVALTVTP